LPDYAREEEAMSTEVSTAVGRFVWHDLMTTGVARAAELYTGLFGWTIRGVAGAEGASGAYSMIGGPAGDCGGLVPFTPAAGMTSHWIGYVAVEDVDATVTRAQELGGKARVPGSEIPGVGRFAVVEDSTGAVFSPFRAHTPMSEPPAGFGSPQSAGTFCFDQLLASDPGAAGDFYSEVLGWTMVAHEIPGMGAYYTFRLATGQDAAGMLPKPAGSGPSSWLPYVAVAAGGLDEAARRVVELGGSVQVPPTPLPLARFAVVSDPTGGVIGLFEPGQSSRAGGEARA
jgi:predicted enzyme related to lactoylglutathione lyase